MSESVCTECTVEKAFAPDSVRAEFTVEKAFAPEKSLWWQGDVCGCMAGWRWCCGEPFSEDPGDSAPQRWSAWECGAWAEEAREVAMRRRSVRGWPPEGFGSCCRPSGATGELPGG